MSLSVMNFSRIRDLVSNLGWKESDNSYTLGADCLGILESIEEELLNEDDVHRNVHVSLHICGTVKKDLIPILLHGQDHKVLAAATRVLVNLSLPIEYLSPVEDALHTTQTQNIRKQLVSALYEIKKSFLNDSATFPVVAMLRESMIKAEKHCLPLREDDCIHLKHCLLLLRNILHLPDEFESSGDTLFSIEDWHSVQNKLIWNMFIQGLDGALLLMLNSKYRIHWTIPLTLIIAIFYKNQNIMKVHECLELVSSASESSGDEEESDGSKNSSTSISSELSKANDSLSDSGCELVSDTLPVSISDSNKCMEKGNKCENLKPKCSSLDINSKLQKVQISDNSESEYQLNNFKFSYEGHNTFSNPSAYGEFDSENSSCSESPHHKRIKSNITDHQFSMSENCSSKDDSGITENMECSSPDMQRKSSDNLADKKSIKNLIAVQKLRSMQIHSKVSESDSSNEDVHNVKIKYRSHPPVGRRGKSPRRNNGCSPSVCMESAIVTSSSKGRVKYPLFKKRNSITTLVDINSTAPSDEDIGNLIKEFTLSYLHCGFSNLVKDIMNLLLDGPPITVDKSLLFWILSYFLHLAATIHINIDHLSYILSSDVISFLIYECVIAYESIELHSGANLRIKKYLSDQLSLVVTALKEIMVTIDLYSQKSCSQKDKTFFSNLCEKIADLQHLRHLPLLLFQNCPEHNVKRFSEDVVILNHYILVVIEKGMEQYPESKKMNFFQHLKHFSTKNIMNCYGMLLENYKYNSNILNSCLFTMMHHIAGDTRSSNSLIQPSILLTFSRILKDDAELEPYQEDLIMYILNKFSHQIKKCHLKKRKADEGQYSGSSDHSSTSSISVNSNYLPSEDDDDLFWWYLQFEQDKDPITRISEHISISKQDILSKLQLKGIISSEKYQSLEMKMETVEEKSDELLSLSCDDLVQMDNFDEEITHLLRTLVQSGYRQHLTWLQDALLETCYVKLGLSTYLPEPIPLYSLKMMTSVPLVPYTEEQRLIVNDDMFLQLLRKIGLQLGVAKCPMYPRIPLFWTVDVLFTIAARLGPMRKDKLKFSYEELLLADLSYDHVSSKMPPNPTLPPLSSCCTLSSWLSAVQKSKDLMNSFSKNTAEDNI